MAGNPHPTLKSYGPPECSWSEATRRIFAKIEDAGDFKAGLHLTSEEVDRLRGALWHLGVFRG